MKLDLARRLLSHDPNHDLVRARNEIVEAEQTARNALVEIREAVSGYRAEGLEVEISRARRSLLSSTHWAAAALHFVPIFVLSRVGLMPEIIAQRNASEEAFPALRKQPGRPFCRRVRSDSAKIIESLPRCQG